MSDWLATTSTSVSNWLEGTTIPAWVVLKIFERYPDINEHFLVDKHAPISYVDPSREELLSRIEALLVDDGMFNHLNVQVQICEDAFRQRAIEKGGAQILQKIKDSKLSEGDREALMKQISALYHIDTQRETTVHENQSHFGKVQSGTDPADRPRAPLPAGPRKTPPGKK